MLRRWLDAGLAPERVTAISPSGRKLPDGVRVERELPLDRRHYDIIMLGFKPQQFGDMMHGPVVAYSPRLLVSMLAGVELAALRKHFVADSIVRAMPNLPVALGKGVVALHGEDRDGLAADLMAPLGLVEWIADEAGFNLVTALAGSGPGFVFRFIDALAEAGAALGLPADQAARLALATVEGAAAMAAAAAESPATLADRVASPGGSTREGLNVLDRDGALKTLLAETLAASARRNAELAKAAG